jgi:hypothetical protein
MLFSLKDLASKLSPSQQVEGTTSLLEGIRVLFSSHVLASTGLHTVKTNTFTLHHFQSLTGMVFIINTTPEVNGKGNDLLDTVCNENRLQTSTSV